MNIYAVLGYIFICSWQPIQIVKILLSKDVSSLSPLAIGVLAAGMIMIQVGLFQDRAKQIYILGNGFAAVTSIILFILYFIYR